MARHQHVYACARWRKLRRAKLQASPLCVACEAMGYVKAATEVDHVVSIAAGGPEYPPLSGLNSLCKGCHSRKTASEQRAHNGMAYLSGVALDGAPVDFSHPWHDVREGGQKDEQLQHVRAAAGKGVEFSPDPEKFVI